MKNQQKKNLKTNIFQTFYHLIPPFKSFNSPFILIFLNRFTWTLNRENNPRMDHKTKAKLEIEMESYETQRNDPNCFVPGKAITAQFNDDAILVYQAFEPKIGKYAVQNQNFEGCPFYNTKRMTWVKTNFTWMMFRSGWGTKKDQEMTLGIWLKRSAFDYYLSIASTKASGDVTVRLQWDPHHDLDGRPAPSRRAIQLGLKGVKGFTSGTDILGIIDLTDFVSTKNHEKGPKEILYPISDDLKKNLKMNNKKSEVDSD